MRHIIVPLPILCKKQPRICAGLRLTVRGQDFIILSSLKHPEKEGNRMTLQDVFGTLPVTCSKDPSAVDIADVVYDSRKAAADTVFVCMTGAETDGHKYARMAYDNGCRAFVLQRGCEHLADLPAAGDGTPEEDVPLVAVAENTRVALALMSDNLFGHPSGDLKVIGVTGTKGKTSITYIVRAMLEYAGCKTGLIGTAGAQWGNKKAATVNTTPESYETQKLLREMADDGVEAVIMEVSSLGVKWHRVDGISFCCGVFTNISPDHIGGHEHKTYEEYYGFKKQFFSLCHDAVGCADDPATEDMLDAVPGKKLLYGKAAESLFRAEHETPIRYDEFLGIRFDLLVGGTPHGTYDLSLPGDFSVENALAAFAICSTLGYTPEQVGGALRSIRVPGRSQIVYMSEDFGIIIDYAHNGMSLRSIVSTMRAYDPGRIITLFGSVGERAQGRREELGTVSGELADFTVITEDDPGREDPEKICREVAAFCEKAGGAGKYVILPDRNEAIAYAVAMLQPGDLLLCCGKGHEKFMKKNGTKVPFDEEARIREALGRRGITIS